MWGHSLRVLAGVLGYRLACIFFLSSASSLIRALLVPTPLLVIVGMPGGFPHRLDWFRRHLEAFNARLLSYTLHNNTWSDILMFDRRMQPTHDCILKQACISTLMCSDVTYIYNRSFEHVTLTLLPPPRGGVPPPEVQCHPEVGKAASKQLSTER